MQLTPRERETLNRMAGGWQPFPMQFERLARTLMRKGLARSDFDDKGRYVLILTDLGRTSLQEVAVTD